MARAARTVNGKLVIQRAATKRGEAQRLKVQNSREEPNSKFQFAIREFANFIFTEPPTHRFISQRPAGVIENG